MLLTLALLLVLAGCTPEDADLELVGTVERTLIELTAPVSEVIVDIPVQRGGHVERGDVVVRMDRAVAEAEVAAAEAALAGARTNAAVAQHDLLRSSELRRKEIASEQQHDRAKLVKEEASARLKEAEARLSIARKRLADLSVIAPVAGVVDQIPFDPGERVPAGAVVAVLLQDEEPWVRVWIPERAWMSVKLGTVATVNIDGAVRPLRGRIIDIAREPEFTPHYALTERERAHLVYEARVMIENAPPALRPGVPADVILFTSSETGQGGDAAHGG
jgi:HlyD family secretion protein